MEKTATIKARSSVSSTKTIKRPQRFFTQMIRYRWLYFMLLPVMAYYVIFCYLPMFGVVIAFKDYNMFNGVFASPWVGLGNFKRIFTTSDFYVVLRNTLGLNLLSLFVGFPAPILLALLLNEVRHIYYKKSVQLIVYLPHFLSWVVVFSIFQPILSNTGMVNKLIQMLGGQSIQFLGNKVWWIIVYAALGIWKEVGWGTIIYLAALTGVSSELYEAARIDGAGRWKQCLNVTLPGIAPTITVLLILRMGSLMAIGFDQPFLFGNSSVIEVSQVISTYVYRIGLESADISRSTAIGLFQSVVNMVMLLTANVISRKISDSSVF